MLEPFNIFETIAAQQSAMSITNLAEILSISNERVCQAIENRSLPAFEFEETVRLDPTDVLGWLQDCWTPMKTTVNTMLVIG